MGYTITEKILARVAGLPAVKAGDEIMAKPDFVIAYDFPGYTRTVVSGRTAYSRVFSGRSPITNATEVTTIYTLTLSDGQLLYIATVSPQNEASNYNYAFRNLIRSIRLND